MAPAADMANYEDQIEGATKWWQSYPLGKYNHFAKARDTFGSYVDDVFHKPKSLMRSASSTNLTFIRESNLSTGRPLKRSPSYSCLSPSHINYTMDRVAPRIVPQYHSYTPETHSWYYRTYAPHQFVETKAYREPDPYVPFIYRKWSVPHTKSYLQGFNDYSLNYGYRLMRNIEKVGHYTYNMHDQEINNKKWARHAGFASRGFCSVRVGLPERHPFANSAYRMYKLRHKVCY